MKNDNNIDSPENGDILDSFISPESTPTEESTNSTINPENQQDNTPVTDGSLDNASNNETVIPLTLASNVTSTKKYEVIINTDTKYILDVDGFGQSYTHNTHSKSLNFKTGDSIELPPLEVGS